MTSPTKFLPLAGLAVALSGAACGDDGGDGPYDLTFDGNGYNAHSGQTMTAAVVDAGGAVVAGPSETTVSDGAFSFTWSGALASGSSYRVQLYADHNGNGLCNTPPTDHSWEVSLGSVQGNGAVTESHNTDFAYVCTTFGDYDLDFTGSGYSPHAGQTLTALVRVDGDDSLVAGPETTTVDSNGNFSFAWPGLLVDGTAYEVLFFADHNDNSSCDAPPTDHAWSVGVDAVSATVTLDETHNLDFTDVCGAF